LELMGIERHSARNAALRFRQHSIDMLHQMAPHQGDVKKLIAVATQGRRELEELWSRERDQRQTQKTRRGEGFHADSGTDSSGGEPPAT
jgi:glutathione-regulated potassium-efflux system ancillary protein KefC